MRPPHAARGNALTRFPPAREAVTHELHDLPWRRLVVIGDSLAEGVGDPVLGYADLSWADRLAAALDPDHGHIDHLSLGVRGLSATAVRRTQLEAALRFGPDLAVVCAGGNDALGRVFEPSAVTVALEDVISALAQQGALPVTFGLFDLSDAGLVPDGRAAELQHRISVVNAIARDITERHRGVHVDFFGALRRDRSLLSTDRIHPNRRGHAHIAAKLVQALSIHQAGLHRHDADVVDRPRRSRTGQSATA